MSRKLHDLGWVVVAYVAAALAGVLVLVALNGTPLWRAFVADIAATVVVFAFSRIFRNSSLYDPYWSVIPPLLAGYWLLAIDTAPDARQWLVFGLIVLWGVRLTWNWAAHWPGLHHEDWRYPLVRNKYPKLAWVTDFFGIHLFPTLQVFAGLLPVYAVIALGDGPLGWLDMVAAAVTLGAIGIETVADVQLHRFLPRKQPGQFMQEGLWAWSRHPNYFGEVSFWVGLALFGLAAYPQGWWWVCLGAVLMTLMFLFVSIPLMDRRSLERRPGYREHMARVSALVPWPPGKGTSNEGNH